MTILSSFSRMTWVLPASIVSSPEARIKVIRNGRKMVLRDDYTGKVEKVNTLRAPRKWRRRGRAIGQTQAWKRAMVVLAEDQVIEVM